MAVMTTGATEEQIEAYAIATFQSAYNKTWLDWQKASNEIRRSFRKIAHDDARLFIRTDQRIIALDDLKELRDRAVRK